MIIRDTQVNTIDYSLPQVIIVEITPNPSVQAANTNVMGLVAQFNRGANNKAYSFSNMTEAGRKVGTYVSGLDGYLYSKDFFDAFGGTIKAVRVTTGTVAMASGLVADTTTGAVALFTLVADTGGTWGNSVDAYIQNNPITGYFDITIRNQNTTEFTEYKKTTTNTNDTRYISTLVANDPKKFFTISVHQTDGTMPTTGLVTFSGGTNGYATGSAVTDLSYIGTESGQTRTGLKFFRNLSTRDVSIVESARSTTDINTELRSLVNVKDVAPRRTIIAFAQGTSVDTAVTAMSSIDDDRVKVVYPWVKRKNPFTLEEETVNPTSFAAGIDTSLSYHLSASQAKMPVTVTDVELEIAGTDLTTLTRNRINPIALEEGLGFILKSDYTTSSNPRLAQNVVRKAKDFFARSFESFLQKYISKPITPTLWKNIKDELEAFLRQEANGQRIGKSDGSKPFGIKIDSQNNPTEVVQANRVKILTEVSLLSPADIIQMDLDASQDKQIFSA